VPEGFDPGIGACGLRGVEIIIDPSLHQEFGESISTVVTALRYLGIKTSAYTLEENNNMRINTVHIEIGSHL
jgi:hypothetical protein